MRRRDGGREGTRRTPALGRRRAGIGTALVAALLVSAVLSASASAAAGGLDPSFSGDGKQTTDFGTPEARTGDQADAVAIQGDGKIVAVGSTGSLSSSNFALARYNTNGSLDTSFSGDGKQITGFGAGTNDQANGVALQADGKIVAAGGTGFGSRR